MIFDIYEQRDLFKISKCGKKSTLEAWLRDNHIQFAYDSKMKIIAHKKAVDAGLGVEDYSSPDMKAELWLGDKHVA
jgi:hypothetical protein